MTPGTAAGAIFCGTVRFATPTTASRRELRAAMLEVFSREGITDCVCVVTRYFGGILLGTGGLARAYTKGAKDALLAAGTSVERLWDRLLVPCSYAQFERVRQETEKRGRRH